MKPRLLVAAQDPAHLVAGIEAAWREGALVALAAPAERGALAAALDAVAAGPDRARLEALGPGVVVGSGGSSGSRRWCVQPLAHLHASADATARWVGALGLEPAACRHLNPLPAHHVSGLLPLLRSRRWGGEHRWIDGALLRDPRSLAAAVPLLPGCPALLSLVPTQLHRLMADPLGVEWLRALALIWVGGAPLPQALVLRAREAGLPLAPCYGATETAAMVCALAPRRFLAGQEGCGTPLDDVELRVDPRTAAVEVRCGRLTPGWLEEGRLRPLPLLPSGWWRSGDGGRLGPEGLWVLGRLDGAIHSGGETVFPEVLEGRLLAAAAARGLSLEAVLLVGCPDGEWGERLVALVRLAGGSDGGGASGPLPPAACGEGSAPAGPVPPDLQKALEALVSVWAPAERPRRWLLCADLAPGASGKWNRGLWRERLAQLGG